jgi:hypothetical protein
MIEIIISGLLGAFGAGIRNFRNYLVHKKTKREPTKPYWIFMIIMGLFIGNFAYYILEGINLTNSFIFILSGYVVTDLISAFFTIFTGKFLFSKSKR